MFKVTEHYKNSVEEAIQMAKLAREDRSNLISWYYDRPANLKACTIGQLVFFSH